MPFGLVRLLIVVWEELRVNFQSVANMSTSQFLASVLDNWTIKDVERLSMVAWSLWTHRNEVVWKGKYQTPHLVIQSACGLLEQW